MIQNACENPEFVEKPKEIQGFRAKVRQECSELGPARAVPSASAALGARRNVPGPARAPCLVPLKSNLQHPNPDASTTQTSDQNLLPVPPPPPVRAPKSINPPKSPQPSRSAPGDHREPPSPQGSLVPWRHHRRTGAQRWGDFSIFRKFSKISNFRRPLAGLRDSAKTNKNDRKWT